MKNSERVINGSAVENDSFKAEKREKAQATAIQVGSFLLSVFMMLFLAFMAYSQAFRVQFTELLNALTNNKWQMPIWLAIILVLFFFPITLMVILGGMLVNFLRLDQK